MSIRIQTPPLPAAVQSSSQAGASSESKEKADVAKVGREFEAIFVRQMLASTKVAGKGGGYADMAVEALASSITAAGGLGMGRAIEQALGAHTVALHPQASGAGMPTDAATKKSAEAPQVPPGPAVRRIGP